MDKFKVGDKVKLIEINPNEIETSPEVGSIGVVSALGAASWYCTVAFEGWEKGHTDGTGEGLKNRWCVDNDRLEKVS